MQLKTVVLPAPFGPISAVISPLPRLEDDRSFDGDQPAEAHASGARPGAERVARSCISRGPPHEIGGMALRSFRKTDGSRVEIRPRGSQIMISTMAKPNSSMRYWVGSKSWPEDQLQEIEFAHDFGAADHDDGGDRDADLAAHAAEHDDGEDRRAIPGR